MDRLHSKKIHFLKSFERGRKKFSRWVLEAANMIALNLMNDIVKGKINGEKARNIYG
ncbi:hypothetical protein MUO14_22830 [Halobacillus shinanisalinarum]|uniref:Transposase DDE domain-containing protein n=1 Tax=Halobacillus shinanisalinarum TaxID=2932258 RepID=A0ABY4H0L0_9BACI|nr:hypothetical protein [Halobacillus shinanisalinarum]UOQ93182.1 hypothetical protein MUO14_22830 [Halobacillus shinanisalinarum]